MQIKIAQTRASMGNYVAQQAADHLRSVLANQDEANLVVATGSSQFEVLDSLTKIKDIDWSRINGFHLDEYLGLPITHSASFCGYLKQRFVDRVPLKSFSIWMVLCPMKRFSKRPAIDCVADRSI